MRPALAEAFEKYLSPAGLDAVQALERMYPFPGVAKGKLDMLVEQHGAYDFEEPLIALVASLTGTPRSGFDGVQRAEPKGEPEPAQEPAEGAEWEPEDFEQPDAKESEPDQGEEEVPEVPTKVVRKRRAFASDAIFEEPGLRTQDIAVFLFLIRRAGKKMVCWPSQPRIAEACRMPRGTAKESLDRLKELGAVSWERVGKSDGGWFNRYTIHPTSDWIEGKVAPKLRGRPYGLRTVSSGEAGA